MAAVTLGTNIASLNAQRQLRETSSALQTSFERLSSGLRINRPSDDAAGLSISESLKADSRIYEQGLRNISDGISVLTIADGALNELSNIVVRLRELASEAANGTVGSKQRGSLDEGAQALAKEFNRIARTTSFNGVNILDGTRSDTKLQIGFSQLGFNVGAGVGDGSFQAQQPAATGNTPSSVAVGDFNGDGIQDLVTPDNSGNTVSVLLGSGDGSLQARQAYTVGSNPFAVADFNGDGIDDVVSADSSGNTVSVLLGSGDGSFRARRTYSTGQGPQSVIVGDFNGDGVADLVTTDNSDNTLSVLLGLGDGSFRTRQVFATGNSPKSVAVGDFNGDGIPDLASADRLESTVSVLLGTGDGSFGARQAYSVGSNPFSVAVADLNGDGVPDLVSADAVSNTLTGLLGRPIYCVSALQTFSLSTRDGAKSAMAYFGQVSKRISSQRGTIGAFQSRAQFAANTLGAASGELAAAEAWITDADIAEESAALVKDRILQQAGMAVLLQSNQLPALVLNLLSTP
jgi:flagellin-like hook-associated protein FlgL